MNDSPLINIIGDSLMKCDVLSFTKDRHERTEVIENVFGKVERYRGGVFLRNRTDEHRISEEELMINSKSSFIGRVLEKHGIHNGRSIGVSLVERSVKVIK